MVRIRIPGYLLCLTSLNVCEIVETDASEEDMEMQVKIKTRNSTHGNYVVSLDHHRTVQRSLSVRIFSAVLRRADSKHDAGGDLLSVKPMNHHCPIIVQGPPLST
jgi:hypothetical protein